MTLLPDCAYRRSRSRGLKSCSFLGLSVRGMKSKRITFHHEVCATIFSSVLKRLFFGHNRVDSRTQEVTPTNRYQSLNCLSFLNESQQLISVMFPVLNSGMPFGAGLLFGLFTLGSRVTFRMKYFF